MPPPQAACDIYREALIPLKYGDALWEPGPLPDYRRVRLGDVGYIREGMFNLLFPAGISHELTTPGTDVPPSFETLDVGMILPRSTRPPGYLRTRTVKQVGVDVGGSFAVACPVEPGVKISFELTSEQGAVLVTNHPTYRENIRKWGEFEAYIKKHYDSWVDFARAKGYGDVKPVLVTGVDLTKQFAAIAYSDSQNNVECDFSAEVPALASASVAVWGSWRTQGLVHTTCGPDQYRTATRRTQHTYDSYVSESEIPEGNDQCVFIRYYTIRKFLGFKHLKAAAGPHRLPEGDAGGGGTEVDCLEDSPSVTHNVSPDDRDSFGVVAEFIFQRSGATSLLLHHDHIQDFIGENEGETIRLLRESAVVERVEVDENGVGQLVQATPKTNEFSRTAPEDFAMTDKTSGQMCSVNTESAAPTVDTASTSGSLGVTPTNEKRSHISQLNVAIDALNLANEKTSFVPAGAIFRSASVLLVIIRDSAIDRSDLVGVGLSCAEVCGALDEGLRGGRLDRNSQSLRVAINKLSTTVKWIREMAIAGGERNAFSPLLHTQADPDEIVACRRDLEWVLRVFNPTVSVAPPGGGGSDRGSVD